MFSGYEKDNVKIIYPTVEEKKLILNGLLFVI